MVVVVPTVEVEEPLVKLDFVPHPDITAWELAHIMGYSAHAVAIAPNDWRRWPSNVRRHFVPR